MFNAKTAEINSAWRTYRGDKVFFLGWDRHHGPDVKKSAKFGDGCGEWFYTNKQGLCGGKEIESHPNDIIGPWSFKSVRKAKLKPINPDMLTEALDEVTLYEAIYVLIIGNQISGSFHGPNAADRAMDFAREYVGENPKSIHIVSLNPMALLHGNPLIQKIKP